MIECQRCALPEGVKIKLNTFVHRCKYHGKLRKNKYDFSRIAPKKLCPDLFYAAYPYCLALLYDAKIGKKKKGVLYLRCPNPRGNVKIELRVKPMRLKPLFNKIEKWARNHWRPLSLTDKRIIIKIISIGGDCPRHRQLGGKFEFNIGFSSELCPASFHSLYPFLFLAANNKLTRFSDAGGLAKIGCPDAKNLITYIVTGGE